MTEILISGNLTTDVHRRKTACEDRDTEREHHVMTEVEMGVLQLQAEDDQGLMITTRS